MSDPTYTVCEDHDVAGECTQECADLTDAMRDPGYSEPVFYSDYLGGESTIDVSGCHGGPPKPYEVVRFDAVARRVVFEVVHPEGCYCSDPECPAEDEADAVDEYRAERYAIIIAGPEMRFGVVALDNGHHVLVTENVATGEVVAKRVESGDPYSPAYAAAAAHAKAGA